MAIHYDPSSLDSNKTILETLHRIEKYLKDNPIYKVYAINAPYVAGEQYNLTDLIASDSTLAEGDVVFFTNNYYAFVSAVGSEVFSVANASSFKGETGAQGAQGEQGKAGADGTDGVDALVCIVPYNSTNTAPTQGLIINGSALNFNRRPKLNDRFILIWNVTSTNSQYLCIMSVDTEGVIPMQCTVQYEYSLDGRPGEQGKQGETGEMALVYGQVIHRNQTLVENQDIVLTGLNMLVADFNRAPKADDQFVLLYFDTYAQKLYIGYAEVEGINGSTGAVTTVLYRDMHIVTGADGQNGTNGTDGKDALVYTAIFPGTPVVGNSYSFGNSSDFNRIPNENEVFTGIAKANVSMRSWLFIAKVDSITQNIVYATVTSLVETTGATGASFGTLYDVSINLQNTSARAKAFRIFRDSKIIKECYLYGYGIQINYSYTAGEANIEYITTSSSKVTITQIRFTNGTQNISTTEIANGGTITASTSSLATDIPSILTTLHIRYYNDTEIT